MIPMDDIEAFSLKITKTKITGETYYRAIVLDMVIATEHDFFIYLSDVLIIIDASLEK